MGAAARTGPAAGAPAEAGAGAGAGAGMRAGGGESSPVSRNERLGLRRSALGRGRGSGSGSGSGSGNGGGSPGSAGGGAGRSLKAAFASGSRVGAGFTRTSDSRRVRSRASGPTGAWTCGRPSSHAPSTSVFVLGYVYLSMSVNLSAPRPWPGEGSVECVDDVRSDRSEGLLDVDSGGARCAATWAWVWLGASLAMRSCV